MGQTGEPVEFRLRLYGDGAVGQAHLSVVEAGAAWLRCGRPADVGVEWTGERGYPEVSSPRDARGGLVRQWRERGLDADQAVAGGQYRGNQRRGELADAGLWVWHGSGK